MFYFQKILSKISRFLENSLGCVRDKLALRGTDTTQFAETLKNIIEFDTRNLRRLCAKENSEFSDISKLRAKVNETRNLLWRHRGGKLTPEEEAFLFEEVSDDWRVCRVLVLKLGLI